MTCINKYIININRCVINKENNKTAYVCLIWFLISCIILLYYHEWRNCRYLRENTFKKFIYFSNTISLKSYSDLYLFFEILS